MFSSPTPFTPPTKEDDRLSWLRLIRSRKVGAATFRRLLAAYGSAQAALAELPRIARASGIEGYEPCTAAAARAELDAGHAAGARLLCLGEAGYPPLLASLDDAPPVLWCIGDPGLLERPAVAIVGARSASSIGLRMARRLAEGLGAAGFAVVSGLARGIDAAAHAASLGTGTIAVHAGGIDTIYPAENAELARAIAAQGVRIAELPPGVEPQARHFPQRNRIVAGVALGTIVVEAAARSGSLITARDTADLGREVMAVPGHPVDARAAGCNALLREGAVLVRDASDAIEALATVRKAFDALRRLEQPLSTRAAPTSPPFERDRKGDVTTAPAARKTAARKTAARATIADRAQPSAAAAAPEALRLRILERLAATPIPEDALIRDLGLSVAEAAPEILALELDGRLRRSAGGCIARAV